MSGVNIHLHYCKGDLKHVGILEAAESCCSIDHACEKDVIHHSCCDDDNINLKLDIQQNVVQHFELPPMSAIALPLFSFELETFVSEVKQITHYTDSGPPLQRPLYKLFSSYIFYA